MTLYKIRDVEQEDKLGNKEEVIAAIIEVEDEKISLKDGWQAIKDILAAPAIATLTGGEQEDGTYEESGEVKPGDEGYFQAFKDLLITQGFIVEEIKKEE